MQKLNINNISELCAFIQTEGDENLVKRIKSYMKKKEISNKQYNEIARKLCEYKKYLAFEALLKVKKNHIINLTFDMAKDEKILKLLFICKPYKTNLMCSTIYKSKEVNQISFALIDGSYQLKERKKNNFTNFYLRINNLGSPSILKKDIITLYQHKKNCLEFYNNHGYVDRLSLRVRRKIVERKFVIIKLPDPPKFTKSAYFDIYFKFE